MPVPNRRALGAGLLAAALVAAAAGCSQIEPAPDNDRILSEIEVERPKKPYPERLAVAPVQVSLTAGGSPSEERKPAAPAEKAGEQPQPASGGSGEKKEGEKHGSMGPRGDAGDKLAMIVRYRRPLFDEIRFASADDEPAAPDETAPPETSPQEGEELSKPAERKSPTQAFGQEPSQVLWLCPRCEKPVSRTDTQCPRCFLPFAAEEEGPAPAPAPAVSAQEPRPAAPPSNPAEPAKPEVNPSEVSAAQPPVSPPAPFAPPPVETAAPPTPPPPAEPAKPPEPPKERYVCYLCGKEVAPDVPACPTCGVALELPPGYRPPAAEGAPGVPLGTIPAGEMVEIDSRRVAFSPDPQAVQRDIVSAVKGYGVFSDVVPITKPELTGDKDALLAFSIDREYDYLLMPKVTRWEVSYEGINWRYIPAFALWVAAWVPSWWVAGDTFEANIDMEFTLLHVRSGQQIPNWQPKYHGTKRFAVDQFDRGWYPWGILGVPVLNALIDWKKLNEVMAPHALAEIKKELIEEGMYTTFVKYPLPVIDAPRPESVALLVGVDLFEKNIRPLRYPSADLDMMAKALHDVAGFKKVVRMEPRAQQPAEVSTRDNIRNWLASELQRLGRRDTVLLYFSGYGVAAKAPNVKWKDGFEKYFVTSDTDPANVPGTAFPLSEIGDQLRAAKVARALVILDCSFARTAPDETIGYGRTLPQVDTEKTLDIPDPNALTMDFLEDMTLRGGGKNAVVLSACAMNETAMETEYLGDGHGVLTYYFADGTNGAADDRGNKDGQVDLEEVIADTVNQVKQFGTRSGLVQSVQVFGNLKGMQMTLKKAARKAAETAPAPPASEGPR